MSAHVELVRVEVIASVLKPGSARDRRSSFETVHGTEPTTYRIVLNQPSEGWVTVWDGRAATFIPASNVKFAQPEDVPEDEPVKLDGRTKAARAAKAGDAA